MFSACQYDPHHHLYLKSAPPKDQICGTWVIDAERTTWDEASGVIDPQRGHLEITADGQFLIQDLPDFSLHIGPIVPRQSGSGDWWTNIDTQGFAYLWLDFQVVDGKPTEDKCAAAYFRQEGQDYFLHVTIVDPDTGDALVMRKTEATR